MEQEECSQAVLQCTVEKNRHPGQKHDGVWAWVVCVSGVLSCMIVFGNSYNFGLLFPVLLDEFGESNAKTAWVGSLAVALSSLSGPLNGKLCTCFGPRLVILLGSVLCVASLLLTTQAPSIAWMYLTYGGLFGLGSGAVYVATCLEVPQHFIKRRSLATAMITMGPGGGMLLLSHVMQALLDVLQWRLGLIASAGITALCILLGCTFSKRLLGNGFSKSSVPDDPTKNAAAGSAPQCITAGKLTFLRDPLYLVVSFIAPVAFIGHTAPPVHLVRYVQDLGITADLASNFYLCIGLGSLLGNFVTGRLCDFGRFNSRMFFLGGMALSGVSTLLLPQMTSYSSLLVYSALHGLANGSMTSGLIITILACLRDHEEGPFGFGLFQALLCIGYAGGPPLVGFITDVCGSYTPAFYVSGGIVMFANITLFSTYRLGRAEKPVAVKSAPSSYKLLVVTERVSVL